jgi:hypothetical protein
MQPECSSCSQEPATGQRDRGGKSKMYPYDPRPEHDVITNPNDKFSLINTVVSVQNIRMQLIFYVYPRLHLIS